MKNFLVILFTISSCCFIACKKNIPPVNGTINGLPAISLYGSSNAPTDYLFLSTSQEKISYNGNVFSYHYYGSANSIFLVYDNSTTAAKGTLDTLSPKITLTIDTVYGFAFTSTVYTAK